MPVLLAVSLDGDGLGLHRDRYWRHRGVGVVRADVDDVAARFGEALALPEELLGGLLRADLEVVVAGVVHFVGACAARWLRGCMLQVAAFGAYAGRAGVSF